MNLKKKILLLWVIFALLDPDLDSGSGSTDPIESGSNPDPQPCKQEISAYQTGSFQHYVLCAVSALLYSKPDSVKAK